MLIDSHAHLQDKKFARDLERVLERAEDAGIERLICVGDRVDSSRKAIALARRHPRLAATVGIHPHYDATFSPVSLLELEKLARDPTVVGIGEIGLDFHYPNCMADRQIEVFSAQAHLAGRHDLPLVIHCRDAYEPLFETIRSDPRIPRRGVIHCFSGTYEQAVQFLDLGFYLGIGGAITYPNGDLLRETLHRVGLERVVGETDAPYLPPQSKRGRRNEPSYIKHTIKAMADLTDLSYQDAARLTKTNAIRLFRLPSPIAPEIAYSIRKTLYLCITNRCPNDCYFCQRCTDYMVMGHFLKLEEEPTAGQLLELIDNPAGYHEIVLSGLGEPTMRWDVCLETARRLKERGARVRLNTNGLGNLINGRDITAEMAGFIDSVAITLIAQDRETYNRVAKPEDPARAWDAMLEFTRKCKNVVPDVTLSVLAVPEVDVEACRHLAEDEMQVRFRIREYRPKGYSVSECVG
ncbi:MAG: YchF/TatD family DNA exonuclease [bacterium]|nr:YchF/TatD family DNA exonuclease [bacterium]